MRGITVTLPDAAAARLSELQMQRDAALDAAHAAAGRLNRLPPDADQRMRDALASERDRHTARHRALAGLSSKITQWLTQLPAGTVLEPACPTVFRPKGDEKLPDAVERLRSEIKAAKGRLDAVKRAQLPITDQTRLVQESVAQRALAGKPSVRIVSDACQVSWPEGVGVTALLAWIDPQRMIDALSAELHEAEGAMSAQERDAEVGRLQDRLDDLERQEAALLEYAHGNGIDVLPRIDMSPPAFLSCVIAQATAQVA